MKNILIIAACLGSAQLYAQYNKQNLSLPAEETSAKFTYGNMRIYPVYANQNFTTAQKNVGKYTTLKDALDKKKVNITEKSSDGRSGAEVNKLYIQNTSADTIVIIGGEVVQGGKQDRVIANDVIIPPKSGKIDLSVYCVEHGRWSPKSSGAASYSFSKGENSTVVNTKTRKAAAVERDQGKVWKEVQVVTDKNDAKSSTGAFTAMETKSDINNKLSAYKKYFKTILASDIHIIGMAVATGDSILGCDMFATHALLMEHADNLIASYATEVITTGKPVTVPFAKVKSYMDNILADETKQEQVIKKNGTMLKEKDSKLHIAVY